MQEVPKEFSFPKAEEEVLRVWEATDAFKTSIKRNEGNEEFTFYDGPPFATGKPHYGHILAGTVKDTITRYANMCGYHVERRFGWDCHGLPVEYEIDKTLGLKGRDSVLEMGIPKYNAECRGIVLRYVSEWDIVVKRLGRWIDMENAYRTMDLSFMESIWWVFGQMFQKGLIYRGFKVMPYSLACNTPLSNFESHLAYKDVADPSVVVGFPLVEDKNTWLLIWTTTPWSLPTNIAVCVHPEFNYLKVADTTSGRNYILCETRLSQLYKDVGPNSTQYKVVETYTGNQLKGLRYVPLFDDFLSQVSSESFQVLADEYVTADSGTGIVHTAPAFGEDDYRIARASGLVAKDEVICPLDANGRFTSDLPWLAGKYIKDADKDILQAIKAKGRLIQSGTITHSAPFCWRSDTQLIYRAVPCWFVAVEQIRDKMLKNIDTTYWVPGFVKEKRFFNWLKDARDWAISRNRYWGTPLPLWVSEDMQEIVCVSSVEELEKLSGVRVTDLHRENVDHITIPSREGRGELRRVDEVFDCWFENGSMPYAQVHYPFENKELFEKSFPANFISEGIDQTRGWFYTLTVVATILFDKPAFQNLIVSGLVLASDGKKMSKRLKNYPDPLDVVNKYGADALRLYLINSPVVRAETLRFSEKGVHDIVKDVFLPWYNAYCFFVQHALAFASRTGKPYAFDAKTSSSSNRTDHWILGSLQSLVTFVTEELKAYRLYTVIPKLLRFVDQLTNWHVRLNRRRFKKSNDEEDCRAALDVLFNVLLTLSRAMAPFTPFLAEHMYQNLRHCLSPDQQEDSVHYLSFPSASEIHQPTPDIEEAMSCMRVVVELGRTIRERKKLPLKMPLNKLLVLHKSPKFLENLSNSLAYVKSELNVQEVEMLSETTEFVQLAAEPDRERLGKRLRSDFSKVSALLTSLTQEELAAFEATGKMVVGGFELSAEEVRVARHFRGDAKRFEALWDTKSGALVVLDAQVDDTLRAQGTAREVVNRIQRLRKHAGLATKHSLRVFCSTSDAWLRSALNTHTDLVVELTGAVQVVVSAQQHPHDSPLAKEDLVVLGAPLNVVLVSC